MRLVEAGQSQIPATHMLASGQNSFDCDIVVNGLYTDVDPTFKQIQCSASTRSQRWAVPSVVAVVMTAAFSLPFKTPSPRVRHRSVLVPPRGLPYQVSLRSSYAHGMLATGLQLVAERDAVARSSASSVQVTAPRGSA